MVDTVRTLSTLQSLLSANSTGAISSQDLRDLLVSLYFPNHVIVNAYKTGSNTWAEAHNDAIAAATAGDTLILPDGEMSLDDYIDVDKQIDIQGQGLNSTIYSLANNTSGWRFNVGSGTKIFGQRVTGFTVSAASDRASGSAVDIGNIGKAYFEIRVSNGLGGRPFDGIVLRDVTQSRFLIESSGCANNGFSCLLTSSESNIIDIFIVDGSLINSNQANGIYLLNTNTGATNLIEGIQIGAVSIYANVAAGIRINAATDCEIKTVHCRGTIIDSNTLIGVLTEGAGLIHSCTFDETWCSTNGNASAGHGYYFSSICKDMIVNGGHTLRNYHSGIYVDGAIDTKILNNNNYSNNRGNNSYYGITVAGNAPRTKIIGGSVDNSTQYANPQNGIQVASGSVDTTIGPSYIATGVGTTPYTDAGTRTRVFGVLKAIGVDDNFQTHGLEIRTDTGKGKLGAFGLRDDGANAGPWFRVINGSGDFNYVNSAFATNVLTFRNTGGIETLTGSIQWRKGSDVASASTLTPGSAANSFDVTGSTTIDYITTTGWQAGAVILLKFEASVTVTHNAGSVPGSTAAILLAGAANFSATADDTLLLLYDGANWREIARTVV